MFAQAGFNHRVHRICCARVSRIDGRGSVVGQLVRWESGDMAWASRTQIAWGKQVHIHNFIYRTTRGCLASSRFPQ